MLYDHLAPRVQKRRTSLQPQTRISKPGRPLTRHEREDLHDAAALRIVNGETLLFHVSVVNPDALWETLENTGLDLVVATTTPSAAYSAWERHAESVGATGAYAVCLRYTPKAPPGRKAKETCEIRTVDLDWLLLQDLLEPLDRENEALGIDARGYR